MKRKIFPIEEEKDEKLNNDSKADLTIPNQNQTSENNSPKEIQEKNDIDIEEEIEKERQKKLEAEREKEELKKVTKILKLDKDKKSKDDIKILKDYLSTHYDYFKNLLKQSEERFLKLITLLKYETFNANERIMNFGEEGDKCYVLLKGSVGIYKPFPITKRMTLKQYVEYLSQLRDDKTNKTKFERILNYNSRIDKNQLYLIDFDPNRVPRYTSGLTIVLEEERELATGKAGISFGEMALIKNEPRNASIIALENCHLLSIEKVDYTKIVKDIEEQRIIKQLASFKEKFPIFKFWPSSKCFPLLSGLITQEVGRDEYVYKQNDYPTDVYIIHEGIFEVTTYFNFDTYERFIEYIHDTNHSLIPYIDNPNEWKEDKNARRIEIAFKENLSPFTVNLELEDKIILSHKDEEKLENKNDAAKNIEDELNKNKKIVFKANIQKLYAPDIFGFVEVLELKQRLTNIKCISNHGLLEKFPLREFLQLLPTDKRNNFYLQQRVYEEKKYLIAQLKNTTVAKLNFVKIDIDKNLLINKNFFIKKPRKRNLLGKKKEHNIFQNQDLLTPMNESPQKLIKSKSFLNYNFPIINKNVNFQSNESNSISEEFNIFPEPYKKRSRNIFINGFKSSILNLTKNKIKDIKNLYPLEEIRLKPNFLSSTNIKEIDNSEDDYVKFLGNNMQYAKTPQRIGNDYSSDLNLMTGKKYVSLEANKIINELKQKEKVLRKIATINEKKDHGFILPIVKFKSRSNKKNKSEIVKIKKISFKTGII